MPKFWRREVSGALQLTCRDWFIDPEIMIKARYLGLRVREVPVHYWPRIGGRSGVRIRTVWEFLRNASTLIVSGRLRAWKQSARASHPCPVSRELSSTSDHA